MSSPTTQPLAPGNSGTPGREVADFVAAVRAQLGDLSSDEVLELTGGLEADLTDALAEEGSTPAERYGDPAAYASELRAAAGLPPRAAGRRGPAAGGAFKSWTTQIREDLARGHRVAQELPWWAAVHDFLLVLRPVWWVLRAWVAVQLMYVGAGVDGVVRGGFVGFLLLLIAIVISVQLGRRSPLPQRWQRVALAVANVFAVIVLLPVVGDTSTNYQQADLSSFPTPAVPGSGLSSNGEQLTNVFPYDSQGRPLTGVQLYDQSGRLLEIGEESRWYTDDSTGASYQLVPGSGQGAPPRWNVFPMQRRDDLDEMAPVEQIPLPFAAVPPLIAAPTASATPSPSLSLPPSASPSPSATK